MRILGFDPGITGAVACIETHASVFDLPTREISKTAKVKRELDPEGLDALLRHLVKTLRPVLAIVERTASRPGQGVASMFSMGVTRGMILGALATRGVKVQEVTPAEWKKAFGLIKAPKEESLRVARELYPELAPQLERAKDHNRAEALLIAHYGKRFT